MNVELQQLNIQFLDHLWSSWNHLIPRIATFDRQVYLEFFVTHPCSDHGGIIVQTSPQTVACAPHSPLPAALNLKLASGFDARSESCLTIPRTLSFVGDALVNQRSLAWSGLWSL